MPVWHPELSDDPRFATNQARMENNDAIQQEVASWVAGRPRAEGLSRAELAQLTERGVIGSA